MASGALLGKDPLSNCLHVSIKAVHLSLEPCETQIELGAQTRNVNLQGGGGRMAGAHQQLRGYRDHCRERGGKNAERRPDLWFVHGDHLFIVCKLFTSCHPGNTENGTLRRSVDNRLKPIPVSDESYAAPLESAHEAASNARTVQKSFSASCGVGQLDSFTPTTPVKRFM